MAKQKSIATALLTLLLLAGWLFTLRPTALGGNATYILVSGTSMEPTYFDGDLVILHKRDAYKSGDIVAYKTPSGQRIFIHRIVGQDAEGFITQGDNREEIDPWRPTGPEMLGSEWLRIPNAGRLLSTLRDPNAIAAIASGILLVGVLGGAEHQRRRGKRMSAKQQAAQAGNGSPSSSGVDWSGYIAGVSAAGALALACLALSFFAFRTAVESEVQESVPAFTHEAEFGYAIIMDSSTLYPSGVLRSPTHTSIAGEGPQAAPEGSEDLGAVAPPIVPPAFTTITREAQVTFEYTAANVTDPSVQGTVAFDLEIRADNGFWTRRTILQPAQPFTGSTFETTLTLDMKQIAATLEQIATETVYTPTNYELLILPRVELSGVHNGQPFISTFEPSFVLGYDRTLIRPPADLTESSVHSRPVTTIVPNSLSIPGLSLDVRTARTVGIGGLGLALVAMASVGGYMAWRLWNDENARIRARYGSRLMQVQTSPAERRQQSRRALGVASMRDLARLAERYGTFILHEPLPNGHRYFIRDNDDTFEYVARSNAAKRGSGQSPTTAPEN